VRTRKTNPQEKKMEAPPNPPQNAVQALAYALAHPDAFEDEQNPTTTTNRTGLYCD